MSFAVERANTGEAQNAPSSPPRRTLLLIVASAMSILILPLAYELGHAQQQITSRDREYVEDMLLQVHSVLKRNYYDKLFHGIDIDARYQTCREQIKNAKTVAAAYSMIEAYLAGLNDSHTVFIPPPSSKRVTYGFRFQMVGDKCYITNVRPGTDAAQKLHPGDQVSTLDGYTFDRTNLWRLEYYLYRLPPRGTTEFTLRDVSGRVRQESVAAEFQQGSLFKDNSVGRRRLEMEERQHILRSRSAEEGDVFFWRLPAFSGDEGAISHMFAQARKRKALVLDLRGNRGGFEDDLMFTLGYLFDHDVKIGTKIMRNGEKELVAKSEGHAVFTGQLIVLVDSRSSSAAEILARTVQIEHRAIVIGDQSAGSVMGAKLYPLKEGVGLVFPYAVEITEADLVMTDGKSLERLGVAPDVILLPAAADLAEGRDPVLARAAELVGVKLDETLAGKMFPFEWAPANPTH
jgi:carboxyl-terminal processing protease